MVENVVVPKVAVCPICGKKTYLRIEHGGYLNEYPIRVNCINCRTLIKGVYVMTKGSQYCGLHLFNADVEECDVDPNAGIIRNADYVAEVCGELPCKNVREFDGNLICSTPYIDSVTELVALESILERKERLSYFTKNMDDWKKTKSTAFQLLGEGSIEFISIALHNKMGEYSYECDNYLKSLHCLQEIVHEETKYIFLHPEQDEYISSLIKELSQIDKEQRHEFAVQSGGVQSLIIAYRKAIEVFSDFMTIYPNILPAETYMRFKNKNLAGVGIATCSFSDIKTFYQDAYESILSLMYIPVCFDNMVIRGNFQSFDSCFDDVYCAKNTTRNLSWYRSIDNGTRLNKFNESEKYQRTLELPANRFLRNGIGHNNIKYDGITQNITAYDLKKQNKVNFQDNLLNVAVDCLGLVKSAVVMSEMILFLLRQEFRFENVHSIIHPRFYKNAKVNDACPCGSGKKYKKCCMNDVESTTRKTP